MIVDMLLALIWYFTLTVFGLMVLPISMRVFRRLPERGILLARPLGWLLLACITWQLCNWMRLPFAWGTIAVVGLGLIAGSFWLLRKNPAWYLRSLRQRWRTALNGEILTVLTFIVLLFIRGYDPNVDNTEKPMDLMMVSALTAATSLPPQDLWYAGEPINYHYGGYLLYSIPAKLLGMTPEYTYNLAIPSIAALAASVAFVLGRTLFGRCRWGAISVITTLFLGNLASSLLAFSRPAIPASLFEWRWTYLFSTSRVIIDPEGKTINEYPFFTLLWGDVHPHFSNLPFFLLFVVMCFAFLLAMSRLPMKRWLSFEWPLLLCMLASGCMLLPTNIFDFPVLSFFFGSIWVLGIALTWKKQWHHRSWAACAIGAAILLVPIAAYILASVFWLHFQSPLEGVPVGWVSSRTSVFDFLMVFGLHSVVVGLYFYLRIVQIPVNATREEIGFVLTGVGIVCVVLWALTGSLIATLAPLVMVLLWMLTLLSALPGNPFTVEPGTRVRETFCLLACALSWSLIAACEYIYLTDQYGGRLNTLFKFHLPAWLLMGIALPPLVYHAVLRMQTPTRVASCFILGAVLLVGVYGPAYTLYSFYALQKHQPYTLNALTFAERGLPGTMDIVHWLRENAEPGARILEVPGRQYNANENLVSAASGHPAYIGWSLHESLWRGRFHPVFDRANEAVEFFTTKDWNRAREILQRNEIDYVVFTPIHSGNQYYQRYTEMMLGAFRTSMEPIVKTTSGQPHELYRVQKDGQE